jgi:hypothetical protein
MKELTRISASLVEQVMAHQDPVVILNEGGSVIFGNNAWLTYQIKIGAERPYGIGSQYETILPIDRATAAGRYIQATIDQGVSEVRIGVQPLFTKECSGPSRFGPIKYRLTATRCRFVDGGAGVIIWCECIKTCPVVMSLAH